MTFWWRKFIFVKQNYEIHNQKLLIIIIVFKQWKHYLKNNFHFIEMWFDHNNFRNFMKIKKLNQRQTRWIIKLIVYNFEIFHRFDFKNSANESFKRFDYKNVCFLNIKLLSTLKSKLTLTINDESLSQNKRKKTFFDYILTNVQFNAVDEFAESSQNKRKILIELISVFQLTEI